VKTSEPTAISAADFVNFTGYILRTLH
jgi:hypothetical protein